MTKEEQLVVEKVYEHFYSMDNTDKKTWTVLDEQLSHIENLSMRQSVIEAYVLYSEQTKGEPRCSSDHPITECFVPYIIQAVGFILLSFEANNSITAKNLFVIKFYIAASGAGFIKY